MCCQSVCITSSKKDLTSCIRFICIARLVRSRPCSSIAASHGAADICTGVVAFDVGVDGRACKASGGRAKIQSTSFAFTLFHPQMKAFSTVEQRRLSLRSILASIVTDAKMDAMWCQTKTSPQPLPLLNKQRARPSQAWSETRCDSAEIHEIHGRGRVRTLVVY